jgi:hypothetical protein
MTNLFAEYLENPTVRAAAFAAVSAAALATFFMTVFSFHVSNPAFFA